MVLNQAPANAKPLKDVFEALKRIRKAMGTGIKNPALAYAV